MFSQQVFVSQLVNINNKLMIQPSKDHLILDREIVHLAVKDQSIHKWWLKFEQHKIGTKILTFYISKFRMLKETKAEQTNIV
jgi:hypothetical protein